MKEERVVGLLSSKQQLSSTKKDEEQELRRRKVVDLEGVVQITPIRRKKEFDTHPAITKTKHRALNKICSYPMPMYALRFPLKI